MAKVRLLHGKPLLVGGKVALSDDCCCGGPPVVCTDVHPNIVLTGPTTSLDINLMISWCLGDCGGAFPVWYQFYTCIGSNTNPGLASSEGGCIWGALITPSVDVGCTGSSGTTGTAMFSGASTDCAHATEDCSSGCDETSFAHDCCNDFATVIGGPGGFRLRLYVGLLAGRWYVLVYVDFSTGPEVFGGYPFCTDQPPPPIAFYGSTTDISSAITNTVTDTSQGGLTLDDDFIELLFSAPMVGTGIGFSTFTGISPATALITI